MIRLLFCALVLGAVACGADKDAERFFDDRVAPILIKNCLACHNHELDDGDISFESRDSLLRNREGRGAAIVPGDPGKSVLVRVIRHGGDVQMPPGKKLTERDIATLTEWVERKAPWGAKLRAPH